MTEPVRAVGEWDGAGPDPGYGDPRAPVGTPEWAKRWRMCFCNAVKGLPRSPSTCVGLLRQGEEHRAWTLVKDRQSKPYPDFDSFCKDKQPYGLEMDPKKFRAYLVGELGDKVTDLITNPPGEDKGGHHSLYPAADIVSAAEKRKNERLRAILRAPELVQDLYREDRITQTDAARMGPKSPTPDQAARVAEARQGLERLDRKAATPEFRRQARAIIATVLGSRDPTPLDLLRKAWAKASNQERVAFLKEVSEE